MSEFEYQNYLRRHNGSQEQQVTANAIPNGEEDRLHVGIQQHCNAQWPMWIALHGSMAHKAMRTPGEWDFTILADRGRVFFFECKTKSSKPDEDQRNLIYMAGMLGHPVHVIRSMEEFFEVVK